MKGFQPWPGKVNVDLETVPVNSSLCQLIAQSSRHTVNYGQLVTDAPVTR